MTTQNPKQANLDLNDWSIHTENSGFDAEEVRTFLSKGMHAYVAHYERHLREKAPGKWRRPWGVNEERTFYMRMATRGAGTKVKRWRSGSYHSNEDMIMRTRHSGMAVFTIYWFDQRGGLTDEEQMLISANRDKPLKLKPQDLKEFFHDFVGRFWVFDEHYYNRGVPAFVLPSDLTLTWRWPKIEKTQRDVDKVRKERVEHIQNNFRSAESSIREIRYQRTTSRREVMNYFDIILTHLGRDQNNMDVAPLKAEIEALTAEVIKMTDAVDELCMQLEKRIEKQSQDIKTKMEK